MSLKPNQIVLQAGRVSTKNDIDQVQKKMPMSQYGDGF
ncbi:hypothetical protein QG37_02666 [Candidozyma auris]|nr:hypothetical protein QG37_02666 [[Candida] auris]